MRITLILGDWSDDSHGKTSNVTIESNISYKGVIKAYKAGSEKIGFNLSEEVARDYDDSKMSDDVYHKLLEGGFKFGNIDPTQQYGIDRDLFVRMYLFVVKLGNPQFKYKVPRNEDVNIGGHGLFS